MKQNYALTLLFSIVFLGSLHAQQARGWNLTHVDVLNTPGDEYSPRIEEHGLLYSRSPVSDDANVSLRTELMYSAFRQNGLQEARLFSDELSTPLHESSACLGPNEDFVIFSRNSPAKRNPTNYLYLSKSGVLDFQEAEPLPFNDPRFNSAHPTLDDSGKRLLFASDRPGGFGGFDLYYAEYSDGKWSKPINLGKEVNSKSDEIFPNWGDNNLITFSSNRPGGQGGLDLYLLDASQNGWKRVEHLGRPFSSEGDDQGLTWSLAKGKGFLASNREGGKGGDDIYSFTFSKESPIDWMVHGEVEDVLVLLNPAGAVVGRLNEYGQWSGTLATYPDTKNQRHVDLSKRLCGTYAAGEMGAPDSITMNGIRIEVGRSDFLQPLQDVMVRNETATEQVVDYRSDKTGGICLSTPVKPGSWIIEKQGFAPQSIDLDPARPYVALNLNSDFSADSIVIRNTIAVNRRISSSLTDEILSAVSMLGVESGYQLMGGEVYLLSTQTNKAAKAEVDKLVQVLRKAVLVHSSAQVETSGLSVYSDEGLREQEERGSTAEAVLEVELRFQKVPTEKGIGLQMD